MKKSKLILFHAILLGISLWTEGILIGHRAQKTIYNKEKQIKKFRDLYTLTDQWLSLKLRGLNLEKYFLDRKIKRVAIYGLGQTGKRLLDELKDSKIQTVFGMDRGLKRGVSQIQILTMKDDLPQVDLMIVTPVYLFDEIENQLKHKVNCPVVSLEDIIYSS